MTISNSKKVTTHSVTETNQFAKTVADELRARGLGCAATVIALRGDLGAGKTAFTAGLLAALGTARHATSPTFVIMKHYALGENALPFRDLYHIDAYRITGEDLESIDFQKIISDPTALVVIEWADRLSAHLPSAAIQLQCEHGDKENERHFSYY